MPDVPSASLYRHIKILNDSAFIIVVEENRIRGTVENVYSLNREALEVDDENGTAVQLSLLSLCASFAKYFSSGHADPQKDLWMENVYYAKDMDCFIVAEMEENTLLLQSILCENHVTLLDVLQRVRGEYYKCQLGFTPALKDMDICVAEQYDGADDYRLFYLGKQLKRIEDENLYFPELLHA